MERICLNGRQVPGFALGDVTEGSMTPANKWAEILVPTGILVLICGVWYFAAKKA